MPTDITSLCLACGEQPQPWSTSVTDVIGVFHGAQEAFGNDEGDDPRSHGSGSGCPRRSCGSFGERSSVRSDEFPGLHAGRTRLRSWALPLASSRSSTSTTPGRLGHSSPTRRSECRCRRAHLPRWPSMRSARWRSPLAGRRSHCQQLTRPLDAPLAPGVWCQTRQGPASGWTSPTPGRAVGFATVCSRLRQPSSPQRAGLFG